jgi:tetratricopeptide (TPR) repeat protein
MRSSARIITAGLMSAGLVTLGCAGTQKLGQTSGQEMDDTPTSSAPASRLKDPLAAGASQPVKASDKRAVTESQQKAYDRAVERWQKAVREGTFKAECAAIASEFGDVYESHPALIEARGNQAAVLQQCGRAAEAAPIWQQLAEGPKPYAMALSQLGYEAWQRGDIARAEALFTRAVEIDKQIGSVPARLNLAQLLRDKARKARNPSEALQYVEQGQNHLRAVLAVDGNNLQAYATLTYFYYDLDYPEMALLVGQQAIWRAEEIATGKFQGTKAQLAGEDRAGTAKRGKKGAEAAPKVAEATVTARGTGYTPEMKKSLGMVYNTLGLVWLKKDVSQAIANFRRAVDMDPELHEARMNLAALSLNYRNYPVAEENFRTVVAAQPKNYEAAIGLGVALRGNKKFEEAEQQYLTAQRLDPQHPDSYFNLGLLYQEYKGIDKPALQKAQQFYRDFIGRARSDSKRKEAQKRIKDIDDTLAALDEAAKMQKEAEEMQRKMEDQQKKMEEEMKKMQEQEKQQAPAPAAAAPQAQSAPAPGAGGKAAD